MSDIAEMVKELRRAVELDDEAATLDIARQLATEAQDCNFAELGESLVRAVRGGSVGEAMVIASALAREAFNLDAQSGDFFGRFYHAGHRLVDTAFAG